MAQLSRPDLEQLGGFVRTSESFTDEDAFRAGVLPELRRLVPADSAVFLEPTGGEFRWTIDPPELTQQTDTDTFHRLQDEHPIIRHFVVTGDGSAVKLSDFLTGRELHQLGLYREFFRPVGIEYQLVVGVGPPGPGGFAIALNRREPDFSERDRLMMNMLHPYLIAAHRNVLGRMRLRQSIEALERGPAEGAHTVLLLGPDDRLQLATERARRWIEGYFDDGRAGRLPEELADWLRRCRMRLNGNGFLPGPAEPLVVPGEDGRLVVRFLSSVTPEGGDALLLEEVGKEPGAEDLRHLGLRPREAEVLALVARGLSNKEIAAKLVVSPRTVSKHLERIYETLDVRTRTAAVTRVREARAPEAA